MLSNSPVVDNSYGNIFDTEDGDDDEKSDYDATALDELDYYLLLVRKIENKTESKNEDLLLWWKKYNMDLRKVFNASDVSVNRDSLVVPG